MTTRTLATIAAATTLTVLLITGKTATGSAPVPKPMMDTTHKHQPARGRIMGMPGMAALSMGPHQVLAMAYRDNLTTFTRGISRRSANTSPGSKRTSGRARQIP